MNIEMRYKANRLYYNLIKLAAIGFSLFIICTFLILWTGFDMDGLSELFRI
ncbi:hypothetical protein ACUXCC_004665 [Cytobacillus horneckiae]|uniref:hypothetical protein n=1 Tax=Cytobacillus horneckiae TaxID=549687 RepID=UPI00203BA5F8|nr:hypothetical protein [Cytobacillus horneckiae]MCM3178029.1 hypothetical protein [Cytobacillus horneckiae]